MKIICVSGGFDPIHSGHICYLKAAKELGDLLIVALNSDEWLINKKGSCFLPFEERKLILESLSFVDYVNSFKDDETGSARHALADLKKTYPKDKVIFANGGDRTENNIPEMRVDGIDFVFGVGGSDKKNSSSSLLEKWKYHVEIRSWGSFSNLLESKGVKVKEIVINPNNKTSFQKHFKRNEIWLVSQGVCEVCERKENEKNKRYIKLKTHDYYFAPVGQWHQIINTNSTPCHIIEIQYGEVCIENDIERK